MKAYHYTVSDRIESIGENGIQLSGGAVPIGEKLAVWFSTNPVYETTACKAGTKTLEGMIDFGYLPIRYVVDMEMFDWEYHKAHSGIIPAIAKGLESVANDTHANPFEWFAVYEPVTAWLAIEAYRDGQWVELNEDETSLPASFSNDDGFTFSISVNEFLSKMRKAS